MQNDVKSLNQIMRIWSTFRG